MNWLMLAQFSDHFVLGTIELFNLVWNKVYQILNLVCMHIAVSNWEMISTSRPVSYFVTSHAQHIIIHIICIYNYTDAG